MAATKSSKKKSKLTRKKLAENPSPRQRPTYAELRQQLAELGTELKQCTGQLNEALQHQSVTGEILDIIAGSPASLQRVLYTIAERAAALCEAENATIVRVEGNAFVRAAVYGSMPHSSATPPINRDTPQGRALLEKRTIHVHDLAAAMETEYPGVKTRQPQTGVRTYLVTPLLRENTAIGVILVRRSEVRPFSDGQIKVLETFAKEAVIAIENVRLFQDLK